MPFFSKKRKRCAENDEVQPGKKKSKKAFELSSSIGYKEGSSHVLCPSIPNNLQNSLSKELVSLLNTNGGIICFGVTKDGIVRGIEIGRKQEDVYKCTIDEAVKRIHPMVEPSMYRVSFTPVVDKKGKETRYKILEIRVIKGDRFQIYETGCDPRCGLFQSCVYVRNGTKLSEPLAPHQIKNKTIEQMEEKILYQSELATKLMSTIASAPSAETTKRTPLNVVNKGGKGPKKAAEITVSSSSVIDLTNNEESPIPSELLSDKPSKSKKSNKLSSIVSGIKKKVNRLFNAAASSETKCTLAPIPPKDSGVAQAQKTSVSKSQKVPTPPEHDPVVKAPQDRKPSVTKSQKVTMPPKQPPRVPTPPNPGRVVSRHQKPPTKKPPKLPAPPRHALVATTAQPILPTPQQYSGYTSNYSVPPPYSQPIPPSSLQYPGYTNNYSVPPPYSAHQSSYAYSQPSAHVPPYSAHHAYPQALHDYSSWAAWGQGPSTQQCHPQQNYYNVPYQY